VDAVDRPDLRPVAAVRGQQGGEVVTKRLLVGERSVQQLARGGDDPWESCSILARVMLGVRGPSSSMIAAGSNCEKLG
jgi:hypothetical protein